MNHRAFFEDLFSGIDARDAQQFADHFTADGVFRFGNLPPVVGRSSIHEFIGAFFASIGGISHQFDDCWSVAEERAVCAGEVTYIRLDGSKLTVPWATVSRFENGLLAEYLAYVDPSQLYAAREAA
jgi:ketosteroid isomerase-like protein